MENIARKFKIMDCNCLRLWNDDMLLNIPAIFLSIYAAYKLVSSLFGKDRPQEKVFFSKSDDDSCLKEKTNWSNEDCRKEFIEFKKPYAMLYNNSHSTPSKVGLESTYSKSCFIQKNFDSDSRQYSIQLNCPQTEKAIISKECSEKKLRSDVISKRIGKKNKFIPVNVPSSDNSILNVTKTVEENVKVSVSYHEGKATIKKVVDEILSKVIKISNEETILDKLSNEFKSDESLKAPFSGIPQKDSTENPNIIQHTIEDDPKTLKQTTTEELEESPAIETTPEVSPNPGQNQDDLSTLLLTANFYKNVLPSVPLEMIYITLPSYLR